MGVRRAGMATSGMTLGDVRHTEQDYANSNILRLQVPTNDISMDSNELDREYCYNMNKIGRDGVLTMEHMAKSKLEQKSLQSGLAAMRRAFEPYDHTGSGDCSPEVFRKALEVFGLQFTEDQVMALFGCYDKGRRGTIGYYKWMQNVSAGKHCTSKEWTASLEWAERERKWAELEQKWEDQMDQHQNEARNGYPTGSQAREALSKVYDQYFQVDARGWAVPSPKQVQQWMQEAGFAGITIEQARRVVYQLDPSDREQGVISMDEFVAWWDLSQQGTTAVIVAKDIGDEPVSPNRQFNNRGPQCKFNANRESPQANRQYTPYWKI